LPCVSFFGVFIWGRRGGGGVLGFPAAARILAQFGHALEFFIEIYVEIYWDFIIY